MSKDSQLDSKEARVKKSEGQIPITRENQNHNHNTKKQSAPKNNT